MTAYRRLLIDNGAIRPLSDRKTLRMDAAGHAAAAKHIEDYLARPAFYSSRPFYAELPDYVV